MEERAGPRLRKRLAGTGGEGPVPEGARLAFAALLVGAAGIGFGPIFVRAGEVGPVAAAFYRVLFALPVVWLWMELEGRRTARRARPPGRRDLPALLASGLFFAGVLALWHWSLKLTSVANSTLLVNLAPVFVASFAWLLFGERVGATFLAGLATALAGAALLTVGGSSPDLGTGDQTWHHLLGDVLAVLGAIFYAGYILCVSRLRPRFSTAAVMAYGALAACAALLPAALLSGEDLLAGSARGWAVLVGLALVSHVLGQSLVSYALARLPAAFSSVALLLSPVVAAALAWTILDEALGSWQAVGGAVVLAGVVLARSGSARG